MNTATGRRGSRSWRLPRVPPSPGASPTNTARSPRWRRSMNTITAEMTMLISVKNQRCQPPAPARKLNAAPALYMRTMLKKGVTSRVSPAVNAALTHALVARSSTSTAAVTASQRVQLFGASCMAPHLSRAFEVRDAARADRGMAPLDADAGAVVPAALALGVAAGGHVHLEFAAGRLAHARLGRDENVFEIVAEGSREVDVVARLADHHLGLHRRAARAPATCVSDRR